MVSLASRHRASCRLQHIADDSQNSGRRSVTAHNEAIRGVGSVVPTERLRSIRRTDDGATLGALSISVYWG
jgi:hypothetical protein